MWILQDRSARRSRCWTLATGAALTGLLMAVVASAADPGSSAKASARSSRARLTDSGSGADWAGFGRTFGEQHYSPLDQIHAGNVGQLGLVAYTDLGTGNSATGPIAVDGTIYLAHRLSYVRAIDAATGRELWHYDTGAAQRAGHRMRVSWGSRGIAWWNGKVYTGTVDGRLVAIDARTGKERWSVVTVPPDNVRFITGAPRVFDGKVIIGHGGADSGPTRAYVTAYDAETGRQLWRFYIVPGQPGVDKDETTRLAAKTWAGEWWKIGGGGTVWNAMAYDADTDTVFLGTGNGFPWNYRIRSQGKGDNLFLCSIVALSGRTGAYKWHYQVNPGETWDYNAAMDIELADLPIAGKLRKVVMTAPKNGFFYVIDRLSGELISAQPYADHITWASRIDLVTGRPVEDPRSRFPDGSAFLMWPGANGAHSWMPMAFSPRTSLVYIPTLEAAMRYSEEGIDIAGWKPVVGNIPDVSENLDVLPADAGPDNGTSYLQAYDPKAQKSVWRVKTPGPFGGGVVATAGDLVFQGQLDGKFNAYEATTGKLVWSYDAGAPIIAPPISFMAQGRQMVSVITGNGTSPGAYGALMPSMTIAYRTQARRVLTFALGGEEKLPPYEKMVVDPVVDTAYQPDIKSAERGTALAELWCSSCHGVGMIASGAAPDLRSSQYLVDPTTLRAIVHDGALVPNGMPRFEELTDTDLADIRQYLRAKAQEMRR